MIKPTVGRKLYLYNPDGGINCAPSIDNRHDEQKYGDAYQPVDATIVAVHSDTSINVGGFDSLGKPFFRDYVELWQEQNGPNPPGYMHCRWMPYQVGQAKQS